MNDAADVLAANQVAFDSANKRASIILTRGRFYVAPCHRRGLKTQQRSQVMAAALGTQRRRFVGRDGRVHSSAEGADLLGRGQNILGASESKFRM